MGESLTSTKVNSELGERRKVVVEFVAVLEEHPEISSVVQAISTRPTLFLDFNLNTPIL